MTEVQKFATSVVKGDSHNLFVKQACQKFLDKIKREDITYDIDRADHVVRFFETHIYHWEGKWRGQPFKLEMWQKFVLHNIFGLFKDGRRLISKAYIQVPRKNGKTFLSAGIDLYHLFADIEKSPQILIGANNEDQAKICATSAAKIIEGSPTLSTLVKSGEVRIFYYRDRCKQISYRTKDGLTIPMSREIKTKDGFNPSCGIVDEYHEADTSALLDVIRSGQGARMNPLLIVITTAGFKKQGPCYSQLRRVSLDILNGKKKDDSQFSLVYEPDDTDDWTKIKTWKKVNPNYGVSVFPHFLKERYLEAQNEGGTKEVDFKTKNLNMWSDASVVWIQDHIWMRSAEKPLKEFDQTKVWYLGIDMAFKTDWSAAVLISEPDSGGFHDVVPFFWIPEGSVKEKQDKENSNLLEWIKEGLVMTTPGEVTDHDMVAEFIISLKEKYNIKLVICDQAYAIGLMNDLNANKMEAMAMPQSATRLTTPISTLYTLAVDGKLRHGGNPVMRWMIGNCVLKTFTNKLCLLIKESPQSRIDGIDALVNAIVPLNVPEEPKGEFIAEVW